jgi:hypothetical protein
MVISLQDSTITILSKPVEELTIIIISNWRIDYIHIPKLQAASYSLKFCFTPHPNIRVISPNGAIHFEKERKEKLKKKSKFYKL